MLCFGWFRICSCCGCPLRRVFAPACLCHAPCCRLAQALPICKAHPDSPGASEEQTIIWLQDDAVCLRIRRRKNRQGGSGTLKRICSCKGGVSTCAVHTLWHKFFAELPEGAHPWSQISADKARQRLRQVLGRLGIHEPGRFGTHDFRRGHAEVSLCSVCWTPLCPICIFDRI